MTDNKGASMSDEARGAFEFFGKHLVALCVSIAKPEEGDTLHFDAYSGTVVVVDGHWYLLVAGHVLEVLIPALDRKDIRIDSVRLVDSYGSGAITAEPIPFDLATARTDWVNDSATQRDFGIIELREHYVSLMKANGVTPFELTDAGTQERASDAFLLLGFPQAEITYEPHTTAGENAVTGKFQAAMLALQPLPPNLATAADSGWLTMSFPHFQDLSDPVGFSGGPVLGVSSGPPMKYRFAGLQSEWDRNRRVLRATRVRQILDRIRELQGRNPT